MAESAPLKKLSIIKDWMIQADPPKEANGEKNGWPVAIPLFKYSDILLQTWTTDPLKKQKNHACK